MEESHEYLIEKVFTPSLRELLWCLNSTLGCCRSRQFALTTSKCWAFLVSTMAEMANFAAINLYKITHLQFQLIYDHYPDQRPPTSYLHRIHGHRRRCGASSPGSCRSAEKTAASRTALAPTPPMGWNRWNSSPPRSTPAGNIRRINISRTGRSCISAAGL